jgi:hypothetical protein
MPYICYATAFCLYNISLEISYNLKVSFFYILIELIYSTLFYYNFPLIKTLIIALKGNVNKKPLE